MKKLYLAFAIATYAAFLLAACGSSSGSDSNDNVFSDADVEVDSYKDLPSCSEKSDGKTAYVIDKNQAYVCKNGKWKEDESSVEIKSSSSSKQENKLSSSHSEEDDPSSYVSEKTVSIKNKTISGLAQKGPFKAGSVVDIFELELDGKTFAQTGKSFTGKVSNDSGFFKISNVSLKSQYALLRVTGYFKSEINGESVHATLTAVTDLSKRDNVNVNILTHLEYDRVLYLLGKGMNFTSAKKQAEREVLAAFGIEGKFKNTEDMNVFGESESDVALVAISKMLLAGKDKGMNRNEEDLTGILAEIATDLEEDGEWKNIGGTNNSPGDYCPWDNKWQIAKRAQRTMDFVNDDENRCGCSEDDRVCRKICHFVQSWENVGRYCTSSIEDEVLCEWSSDHRNVGGVCSKYSRCRDGEWICMSQKEADTYKWSKGKDGEIKKGNETGVYYMYDAELGMWRKATDLEIDTYKWSKGKDGEIKKGGETGTYYKYDTELGMWREATNLEVDTYKWSNGKDGEIRKGDESGTNYKYDVEQGIWRETTQLDSILTACTMKRIGKITKTREDESMFYCCGEDGWREATESELMEWDTKGLSCNKSGKILSGKEYPENKYVCDSDTFRVATVVDSMYDFACVSYTNGKTSERKAAIHTYTCENNSWKMNDDWSTSNCAKDGSVQELVYDEIDSKKCFVCDADTFRVATKQDSSNVSFGGFTCASYTENVSVGGFSCSDGIVYGILKDSRDGQTYKTVKIGTQIWMAENLNFDYKVDGSSYGSYSNTGCNTCGHYYTWAAAMDSAGIYSENGMGCGFGKTCTVKFPVRGICPEGWQIPSFYDWGGDDWDMLYLAMDSSPYAMQAKGFVDWSNAIDDYGFSALPAGFYYDGSFYAVGVFTAFWSAEEYDGSNVFYWGVEADDAYLDDNGYKIYGYSVRCVKD
ncbi:FISUMP domain-containing protein [Fibrobacter sp.]|uniref:FISUMP domain-containing protein n=1 Tax=Fibrobacter sp. TaxID=35828 RepID=UPI0025BF983D|nr:FISUMP domain-containing protein [Fibrobacter sp.]